MLVTGIYCITAYPVDKFFELPVFENDPKRMKRLLYSVCCTHGLFVVALFFNEVYPVAQLRIWTAFIGQFVVILHLLTVNTLLIDVNE